MHYTISSTVRGLIIPITLTRHQNLLGTFSLAMTSLMDVTGSSECSVVVSGEMLLMLLSTCVSPSHSPPVSLRLKPQMATFLNARIAGGAVRLQKKKKKKKTYTHGNTQKKKENGLSWHTSCYYIAAGPESHNEDLWLHHSRHSAEKRTRHTNTLQCSQLTRMNTSCIYEHNLDIP